jgi:hypothetical protein
MSDTVKVKYIRSIPNQGWMRGDIRTCEQHIAETLCSEPRPYTEYLVSQDLEIITNQVSATEIEIRNKNRKRRPQRLQRGRR